MGTASQNNLQGPWARPAIEALRGRFASAARLEPDADAPELYAVSHEPPAYRALWDYLPYGPFADVTAMRAWMQSIKDSADPIWYTVTSEALGRKVGMYSLLNIVPDAGRAELGHIWYSPLVQRTKLNTEMTYLFLRHLFEDLRYRRVEWKCDDRNEPSKRAALRMGFAYEGLFRQHLIVKGQNRDTAWFSMLDREWPARKANFEAFLASDGVSLTALNADAHRP
jgi:RimJ/RimL family protein N-acetyltransferase